MFCKQCGTQLSEGTVFCSNCGTKVGEDVAPTPVQKAQTPTPAPKKSYTPLAIIIGAIIIAATLAVVLIFTLGGKKDSAASDKGSPSTNGAGSAVTDPISIESDGGSNIEESEKNDETEHIASTGKADEQPDGMDYEEVVEAFANAFENCDYGEMKKYCLFSEEELIENCVTENGYSISDAYYLIEDDVLGGYFGLNVTVNSLEDAYEALTDVFNAKLDICEFERLNSRELDDAWKEIVDECGSLYQSIDVNDISEAYYVDVYAEITSKDYAYDINFDYFVIKYNGTWKMVLFPEYYLFYPEIYGECQSNTEE